MTRPRLTTIALLLAALPGPLAAQSVPLARVASGGGLDLVTIDETSLSVTTVLTEATLLPLGLGGRPRSERFRVDRPREVQDALAPRVHLPGQGSLYRAQTQTSTALVLVRDDGQMVVLAQLASTGAPSLLAPIAVSDDGTRMLVATSLEAGGDVLSITVGGAPILSTLTGQLPPQDVAPESLRVSSSLAWFVAEGAVHRARLVTGQAEAVPAALAPGETVLPELAASPNGRRAAWVTELPGGGRHIWAAEFQGDARRQTPTAGAYDPPSYASATGPLLVVDDDSPWVAWRAHVPVAPDEISEEVFARRITDADPGAQLTADGAFIDTIDSVGVLGFTSTGRLFFLAGEAADEPGQVLGSADVYQADLTLPGTIVNLSLTSGDATAPFQTPGELEVFDLFENPTGSTRMLVVDPAEGDFALLSQSLPGGALSDVLGGLDQAPLIHPAGDSLLLVAVPPIAGPGAPLQELLLLRDDGTLELVAQAPLGVSLDRFASSRDGTHAALVASFGPGLDLGFRIKVGPGQIELLWGAFLQWAPRLAFTGAGTLAAGLGGAGGPYLFVGFDAPSSGIVLPGGVGQGFPLDG